MSSSPPGRWHLAVPPLYLLLIGLLVYLQFGGVRETHRSVAGLDVAISSTRDLGGRQRVRDVTVHFGDLRIALGQGAVTLRDGSGAVERLRPMGAQISSDGLVVTLGSRLELDLRSDGGLLRVDARPLGDLPAGLELALPYRIESGSLSRVPGLPVTWSRRDGCTLYVTGADGAAVDTRRVAVPLDTDTPTSVLRAVSCTQVEDPYEYWFAQSVVPSDTDTYTAAVADFVGRSYPTWQVRVYTQGADLVAQDVLVGSYLAESLTRGGYAAAQASLQGRVAPLLGPAVSASPLPAAYLGLLEGYRAAGENLAQKRLEEIRARIGRGEETVFEIPALLDTVLDHGATSVLDQLMSLASGLPVDTASADLLVDVARFYVDAQDTLGDTVGARARLEDIVVGRLIPSLRMTAAGVFFLPDLGRDELLVRTLEMGRLLSDASRILDRPSLAQVGRQLVVSALSLASGDGNLPVRVGWRDGKLSRSPDALASESVYPLIVASDRLPRQRPLPQEIGVGGWILTAARVRDVVSEAGSLRLSHSFPLGQCHYLVLQGLPALRSVLMHGLPWRPDPEYYRYTDGWWYDPDTRTLYVKVTQQREWEELALQFS